MHFSQSPTPTTAHLKVDGISKSFGARRVLTDISFTVSSGERIGLIGENGAGKSTLLRIIANIFAPDSGTVVATAHGSGSLRFGLLHQQPPFEAEDTIHTALATAIAPVTAAIEAISHTAAALATDPEHPELAIAYAEALEEADRLGAWDVETRVESVLTGLGIQKLPRNRRTVDLSGGERARLSLAWMLLHSPEILLLDEPTNHLDDAAAHYLGTLLQGWPGPVLIASHDRAFLDDTVTSLIDLDPAPETQANIEALVQDGSGSGIGTRKFTGSYSDYVQERRDVRLRWERQFAGEQAELAKLRAGLSDSYVVGHEEWKPRTETRMAQKFYGDRNAKVVSRRVNDARARVETLELNQIQRPPEELTFAGIPMPRDLQIPDLCNGSDTKSLSAHDDAPILAAHDVSVEGRLEPITIELYAGEHLLVTGSNGAGKSTLLKLLAGELTGDTGSTSLRDGTRVGILDQEVKFADPHGRGALRPAHEIYIDSIGLDAAEKTPLSTFGLIAQRDVSRPATELSVGQQRRLALAILLADPPEVLLLDEPTNHLSLGLAEALERAVVDFPGTVVIASHDRWLRKRWTGSKVHI